MVRGSALAALTPTLLPDGATAEYGIDPDPPGWLAFDVFTGAISAQAENTADLPAGKVTYTVTATGTGAHDGKSAMAKITVTVAAFGAITYNDTSALIATAGTELSTERTIVEPADAGHQNVTYSIAPDLTTDIGLAFDPSNGTISGTPTTVAATATDYTVTATGNSDTIYAGYTQTTTLSVTVNPAAFSAIAYDDASALIAKYGTAITDRTITAPTDAGHASVTYSIAPNLTVDTGLAFDPANGTISGTPTKVATATDYIVKATGNSDTIYADYTQTTTLSVTVEEPDLSVSYSGLYTRGGTQTSFSWPSGQDGTTSARAYVVDLTTADTAVSLTPTVPSITGDASFQYSIAGLFTTFVLAANGLDFHQSSGQIIQGSSPLTELSREVVITVTGPLNTVYAGKEVKVHIKITVTSS